MKNTLLVLLLSSLIAAPSYGFGLNDLKNNVDRSHKCKSGDQSCKNREHLKAAARVAAVSIAVKLIADMVVDYRSSKVADEEQVAAEYRNKNKTLQPNPIAERYATETLPGKVVEPGKKVTVKSDIVVVPGSLRQEALIEERITIFDNEDHTKELRQLTKAVNGETRRGGHYQNEFSFTPPEGLPQGVYPIKTELILNGVTTETSSNDIQLVLQVDHRGAMQLLALAD